MKADTKIIEKEFKHFQDFVKWLQEMVSVKIDTIGVADGKYWVKYSPSLKVAEATLPNVKDWDELFKQVRAIFSNFSSKHFNESEIFDAFKRAITNSTPLSASEQSPELSDEQHNVAFETLRLFKKGLIEPSTAIEVLTNLSPQPNVSEGTPFVNTMPIISENKVSVSDEEIKKVLRMFYQDFKASKTFNNEKEIFNGCVSKLRTLFNQPIKP